MALDAPCPTATLAPPPFRVGQVRRGRAQGFSGVGKVGQNQAEPRQKFRVRVWVRDAAGLAYHLPSFSRTAARLGLPEPKPLKMPNGSSYIPILVDESGLEDVKSLEHLFEDLTICTSEADGYF